MGASQIEPSDCFLFFFLCFKLHYICLDCVLEQHALESAAFVPWLTPDWWDRLIGGTSATLPAPFNQDLPVQTL